MGLTCCWLLLKTLGPHKEQAWYKAFGKLPSSDFLEMQSQWYIKEQRTKGVIRLLSKLHGDGSLLKNTMAISLWEIQWCLYYKSVLLGWLCILNFCDIKNKNYKMVFDICGGLYNYLMGLFTVTVHYVPSKRVGRALERKAGCLFCFACCTLACTRNCLQGGRPLLPWQWQGCFMGRPLQTLRWVGTVKREE